MRFLVIALVALAIAAPATSAELTGRTRVVDGDSLAIGAERVRLHVDLDDVAP